MVRHLPAMQETRFDRWFRACWTFGGGGEQAVKYRTLRLQEEIRVTDTRLRSVRVDGWCLNLPQ